MGRTQADYNTHHYVLNSTASFDQRGFNEIHGQVMTQIANKDLWNLIQVVLEQTALSQYWAFPWCGDRF